jgi:hypothetical protein
MRRHSGKILENGHNHEKTSENMIKAVPVRGQSADTAQGYDCSGYTVRQVILIVYRTPWFDETSRPLTKLEQPAQSAGHHSYHLRGRLVASKCGLLMFINMRHPLSER